MDDKSGKYSPFILSDAGYPIYPINSRILSFDEGDKITIFCHGTNKRPNKVKAKSLGLNLNKNKEKIELECKGEAFYYQDQMITSMSKATCTRIMEPEIIKEQSSDCSKGYGADGESEALDVSLVQVGWIFNGQFEEQVERFRISISKIKCSFI